MSNSGTIQDRLFDAVTEITRERIMALQTRNDVKTALDGMHQVVRSAMAEVLVAWNAQRATIVQRIPPEILLECFYWLNARGRVKASCVSRSWRSIALAHPGLWTQFDFFCLRGQNKQWSVLASIVRRSATLPLDIALGPTYNLGPDELGAFAILDEHRHRIRSLKGTTTGSYTYAAVDAPLLENVRITCGLQLGHAPLLRDVCVNRLDLSLAVVPFHRLQTLQIKIGCDDNPMTKLFTFCPNLVSLQISLRHPHTLHLLPQRPIPKTLVDVTLYVNECTQSAAAVYLAGWHKHPFTRLELIGGQPESAESFALSTLQLFDSLSLGPYSMQCGNTLVLEAKETTLFVSVHTAWHILGLAASAAYLQQVQDLKLESHGIFDFPRLTAVPLPALHTLTLDDYILSGLRTELCHLDAPQLREIIFHVSQGERCTREANSLAGFCTNVLLLQDRRIPRIAVKHWGCYGLVVDLTPLQAYAFEVYYGEDLWRPSTHKWAAAAT